MEGLALETILRPALPLPSPPILIPFPPPAAAAAALLVLLLLLLLLLPPRSDDDIVAADMTEDCDRPGGERLNDGLPAFATWDRLCTFSSSRSLGT